MLVRRGHARRAGRGDADGVLVPGRAPRLADLDPDAVAREAVERAARMLGAVEAADEAGAHPVRSVRGVVVPRRAWPARCRPRPCRRGVRSSPTWSASRSAPRCSRSSTTGGSRGPGGRSVRRRGRADRPHRADHERRAERVPARHVHGSAQRRDVDGQREPSGIPLDAGRGHLELLRRARGRSRSSGCSRTPRAAC